MELTGDERQKIRHTLAKAEEPMHLTRLANACGIALSSPQKQQSFAQYVENFLVDAGEAEMVFTAGRQRRGEQANRSQVFSGWRASKALIIRAEKASHESQQASDARETEPRNPAETEEVGQETPKSDSWPTELSCASRTRSRSCRDGSPAGA
jgi:hypothetical protein